MTDEGTLGTQAWLDAYHGTDEFTSVVMPRSGAVQGVVNLDFPGTQDYETMGIFFGIYIQAILHKMIKLIFVDICRGR